MILECEEKRRNKWQWKSIILFSSFLKSFSYIFLMFFRGKTSTQIYSGAVQVPFIFLNHLLSLYCVFFLVRAWKSSWYFFCFLSFFLLSRSINFVCTSLLLYCLLLSCTILDLPIPSVACYGSHSSSNFPPFLTLLLLRVTTAWLPNSLPLFFRGLFTVYFHFLSRVACCK